MNEVEHKLATMRDPQASLRDRLAASDWLAERMFGVRL